MTFFNSQNNQKTKKRLTLEQVSYLEKSFDFNKKLEPNHKLELSRELGISVRQIAIWYQNKRVRWRTRSLELDYNSLQSRLETALAANKQLEMEAEQLRIELEKARQMVIELKKGGNSNNNNYSSCCEEGGSSNICSLHDDISINCQWLDIHDDMELYACLIAGSGSLYL